MTWDRMFKSHAHSLCTYAELLHNSDALKHSPGFESIITTIELIEFIFIFLYWYIQFIKLYIYIFVILFSFSHYKIK